MSQYLAKCWLNSRPARPLRRVRRSPQGAKLRGALGRGARLTSGHPTPLGELSNGASSFPPKNGSTTTLWACHQDVPRLYGPSRAHWAFGAGIPFGRPFLDDLRARKNPLPTPCKSGIPLSWHPMCQRCSSLDALWVRDPEIPLYWCSMDQEGPSLDILDLD